MKSVSQIVQIAVGQVLEDHGRNGGRNRRGLGVVDLEQELLGAAVLLHRILQGLHHGVHPHLGVEVVVAGRERRRRGDGGPRALGGLGHEVVDVNGPDKVLGAVEALQPLGLVDELLVTLDLAGVAERELDDVPVVPGLCGCPLLLLLLLRGRGRRADGRLPADAPEPPLRFGGPEHARAAVRPGADEPLELQVVSRLEVVPDRVPAALCEAIPLLPGLLDPGVSFGLGLVGFFGFLVVDGFFDRLGD